MSHEMPAPEVLGAMALAGVSGVVSTEGSMMAGVLTLALILMALYLAPSREEIVDEWASQYEVDDDG